MCILILTVFYMHAAKSGNLKLRVKSSTEIQHGTCMCSYARISGITQLHDRLN